LERLKKITTNLLLAFALISFGFMLGKNFVKPVENTGAAITNSNHVAVYYLHSTFRCVTCNTIEKQTRELLNSSYRNELANETIVWQEIDFQENETIAKKFDVIASCVVVGRVVEGEFVEYQRLDKVWELVDRPGEFKKYIAGAIDEALAKAKEME
jgi:hypothetical protein